MGKGLKLAFVIISVLIILSAIFIPVFIDGGITACLTLIGVIALSLLLAIWVCGVIVVIVDLVSDGES